MSTNGRDGERFSDLLRARGDSIWKAQLEHPFVQGIAAGTLSEARFRVWLRQDYQYLLAYVRVASLGAARAPDEATMLRFSEAAHRVLGMELDLHRGYAAEFGVTQEELEATELSQAYQSYVDHLMHVAMLGELVALPAALLPCLWGYTWIGEELAKHPKPDEPRYARWIELYSSERFRTVSDWCRDLTDSLAEEGSERSRNAASQAFMVSSRYELACWDQAWEEAG